MEFSRPEYWSGQPFPSLEDLPNPGLPHCRQILYQLSHRGSPTSHNHIREAQRTPNRMKKVIFYDM